MELLLKIMAGVGVLVLSFWITLVATEPPPVSDVDMAAAAAGLSKSDVVVGFVESVQRDPTGRLRLSGWAFDKELAQPVSIDMLIGSKFEQLTVTKGPRADVTQALKETAERAQNVVFAGLSAKPVDCGPFTIVGINQRKRVSIIASGLMVPHCSS